MATDPRLLVGGHATGNLSAEERRELYQAALQDQALFDTLAAEEPLRELVEDPAILQRFRAVLAHEEPARRGFAWFFSSDWLPAAAALLLAAVLVPIAASLFDRGRPAERGGPSVARVTEPDPAPDAQVAAAEWAAAVDRAVTDEARFTIGEAAPKEFEPLGTGRRAVLRVVPDRSGRAMVVGIDRSGDAERLHPPGDAEWAEVEADTPVPVTLPEGASRFVEFRLVIVERGSDVRDLPARLDEGRAIVYRIRPN